MNGEFLDYYEILEIHHKASPDIIKNAYRTLAKKYHPDISGSSNSNDTKNMTLINEAFDVLSNPEKRAAYDRLWTSHYGRPEGESSTESHAEQPHFSPDENAILSQIDNACTKILELLDKNIEHANEALIAIRNKQICDLALAEFTKLIPHEMESLSKTSPAYRYAEIIVALTLWRLGTSFTWGNEFFTAEKLLKQALSYAKPTDDFYSRLEKSYRGISSQADILRKQTRNSNTKFKVWVAIIVIGVLINFFNSKTKTSPPPQPAQPATSSSTSSSPTPRTTQPARPRTVSPTTAPVEVPPVPKANVVTQYVPNKPINNSDGHCQITIDNTRNDYPVYVRIWDVESVEEVAREITIRQNEKFTAKSFDPGQYEIRFAQMYEDRKPTGASKSEPFRLSQTKEQGGIRYSVYSLTLYKVRNGNAQTYSIPISEL